MEYHLLYTLHRQEAQEIAIHGEIVVCDDSKVRLQTGKGVGSFPARSLLKPYQALASQADLSIVSEPEVLRQTAALGSISANKEQVESLKSWYSNIERHRLASFLKLAPSFPMDERNRVAAKEAGVGPQVLFHTCFSKHMGILECCHREGWDLNSYCSDDHPYHARLLSLLKETVASIDSPVCVPDGCLLPSPILGMDQMAFLYQRLAAAQSGPLGVLRDRMMKYPKWIGGPKRVDTMLMELNHGKLIAKEGADGLLALGLVPNSAFPNGLGIVVKLWMGYHPANAALALVPLLERLGLHSVHEAPKGHTIQFEYDPKI